MPLSGVHPLSIRHVDDSLRRVTLVRRDKPTPLVLAANDFIHVFF